MRSLSLSLLLLISLLSMTSLAASVGQAKKAQAAIRAKNFAHPKEAAELVNKLSFDSVPLQPNYFQKVRVELNKAAQAEAAAAKKHGVLINSLIKLTPDTLGFFVATGAVNFMTMWTASGGNPMLFQEQVLGLKDPLAHLSFYSFIAANGFYSNWQTGKLSQKMSPEARQMALRRINYMGMAAGSLASSVVSDIGTTMSSCSRLMIDNSAEQKNYDVDAACESALKQWQARAMTEKYLPQITALLVVQAATDITHGAISLTSKGLMNILKSIGPKAGYQISAFDLALYATPGKFGIQAFKLIGKVTQFTFFVGIDHLINNTVTRAFNNLFKPALFKTFDHYTLNTLFEVGAKYQWDIQKIQSLRPSAFPENRSDKKTSEEYLTFNDFEKKFPEQIVQFSEQLQSWRDHLNSNVEQDLSQWMNLTKRIYNQIQVSEDFYSRFIGELFNFSNINYRVGLPEADSKKLPNTAFNNTTGFPYKTLPLFGIKFIPWVNNDGQKTNVKEVDAYLSFPKETEKAQSEYLKHIGQQILNSSEFSELNLTQEHQQHLVSFLENLISGNPKQQGQALKDLIDYKIIPHQIGKQVQSNNEFIRFRSALLKEIGQPQPKLQRGEGFVEAFELAKKSQIEIADFDGSPLWTSNTSLFNSGSLLMYSMICGNEVGQIRHYQILNNDITLWQPDFMSPRIVTGPAPEFCDKKNAVNQEQFFKATLTNSSGKNFNNVTDYIAQNINFNILGDYRSKDLAIDFSDWWAKNVLAQMIPDLDRWDKNYGQLVKKLDDNLFSSQKISTVSVVDTLSQFNFENTNILSSNISESYQFEAEFYLQTINQILSKKKQYIPAKGEYSVLSESKKIALNQQSKLLTKLTSGSYKLVSESLNQMIFELKKPVTELMPADQLLSEDELRQKLSQNGLLEKYNQQINYKKYLDFKSSFEQAISKIEARVGLKKETNSDIDSARSTFEDVSVPKPTFDQNVVIAAARGLRNIEASLSRYVQMKILVRYGLKFTEDDNKKSLNEAVKKACARGVLGCS